MILFHEGMPGSGKSYEAIVKHVIPALAAGRPVDAFIYELNHEKIAELAGITLERCHELLIELTAEQAAQIWQHARQNALVCLDEAHRFWPKGRNGCPQAMLDYIAEHRHHGQDLLFMDQTFGSVNREIQDRTNKKMVFTKLDSLGADRRYSWVAYQGNLRTSGNRSFVSFKEIGQGFEKYEDKYFGTYASHVSDDVQTSTYSDDRFSLFQSRGFRVWLPLLGLATVGGIWWLISFFTGGGMLATEKKPPAGQVEHVQQLPQSATAAAPVPAKPARAPSDWIQQSLDGRAYSMTYVSVIGVALLDMTVEVWSDAGDTIESWTLEDFKSMGYTLKLVNSGVEATKGGVRYLFRQRALPAAYYARQRSGSLDLTAMNPTN